MKPFPYFNPEKNEFERASSANAANVANFNDYISSISTISRPACKKSDCEIVWLNGYRQLSHE